MTELERDLLGLVASLVATWVLFRNPRELGTTEARWAAASPAARATFWYVLGALLIDAGHLFKGKAPYGLPEWPLAALFFAAIGGLAVKGVAVQFVHPAILETASDEVVRRWRRRFLAGPALWGLLAFLAIWAAIRLLLL